MRPSERDPGAPRLVLSPRSHEIPKVGRDAGRAQALGAASGLGARIRAGGDDLVDAGLEDPLDAGRGPAVVRARLERHEERRPPRARPGLVERDDLGVRAARRLGDPLAHDLSLGRDDDRADGRVRRALARCGVGQVERPFETHAAASRR